MISWIAAGVMVFGFAIGLLRKINENEEDLKETFSPSQQTVVQSKTKEYSTSGLAFLRTNHQWEEWSEYACTMGLKQ
jgi:hypothetical protein